MFAKVDLREVLVQRVGQSECSRCHSVYSTLALCGGTACLAVARVQGMGSNHLSRRFGLMIRIRASRLNPRRVR